MNLFELYEKLSPDEILLTIEKINNAINNFSRFGEKIIESYIAFDNWWQTAYPKICEVIENIDSARDDALEFFYNRCKKDFLSDFIDFANKNNSFHMLNNTIKNDLVENRFLPMMKKFMPDASSLGLRVKNLIFEDLSYCAALVCNRNIDNPDYRKQLINASSDYILRLEKIQLSATKKKRN